jgi:nitroreductase
MMPNATKETVLEQLVATAIRAPSGDNTQPWYFVLDRGRNRIAVYVDEAKDRSPMNAGQHMAAIACGAAVENMLRVAGDRGWEARLEAGSDAALAVISLEHAGEDGNANGKAEETIASRVTNRRLYDGRPTSPELLARLKSETPALEDVSTHWIDGPERLSQLASVMGRADGLIYSEKPRRRAILSHIRFDAACDAEVEDGLSVTSLEASAAELIAIRTMFRGPNWLFKLSGAPHLLGLRACKLVKSASGLCMVVAPEAPPTPYMDLLVGRAMQRAWLSLHASGLAVQPMMSLVVLESLLNQGDPELMGSHGDEISRALCTEFRALIPEVGNGRPAFLMRFGFAPPPSGRTGRRPLSAVTTVVSS